jgi:hypothetical protein
MSASSFICLWPLTSCCGEVIIILDTLQHPTYLNLFFLLVHQFELRTELKRAVENWSFSVQFSSQFSSEKIVKVQFTVQQKVLRTGLN